MFSKSHKNEEVAKLRLLLQKSIALIMSRPLFGKS